MKRHTIEEQNERERTIRLKQAAAQEMYEALKAAFLLAECGEVPARITMDRWGAVLAKAEGKQA